MVKIFHALFFLCVVCVADGTLVDSELLCVATDEEDLEVVREETLKCDGNNESWPISLTKKDAEKDATPTKSDEQAAPSITRQVAKMKPPVAAKVQKMDTKSFFEKASSFDEEMAKAWKSRLRSPGSTEVSKREKIYQDKWATKVKDIRIEKMKSEWRLVVGQIKHCQEVIATSNSTKVFKSMSEKLDTLQEQKRSLEKNLEHLGVHPDSLSKGEQLYETREQGSISEFAQSLRQQKEYLKKELQQELLTQARPEKIAEIKRKLQECKSEKAMMNLQEEDTRPVPLLPKKTKPPVEKAEPKIKEPEPLEFTKPSICDKIKEHSWENRDPNCLNDMAIKKSLWAKRRTPSSSGDARNRAQAASSLWRSVTV